MYLRGSAPAAVMEVLLRGIPPGLLLAVPDAGLLLGAEWICIHAGALPLPLLGPAPPRDAVPGLALPMAWLGRIDWAELLGTAGACFWGASRAVLGGAGANSDGCGRTG